MGRRTRSGVLGLGRGVGLFEGESGIGKSALLMVFFSYGKLRDPLERALGFDLYSITVGRFPFFLFFPLLFLGRDEKFSGKCLSFALAIFGLFLSWLFGLKSKSKQGVQDGIRTWDGAFL